MLKIITTDDAGPIVLQRSLPELMLQEQTETGHVQGDPENTEKTLKRGDGTKMRPACRREADHRTVSV